MKVADKLSAARRWASVPLACAAPIPRGGSAGRGLCSRTIRVGGKVLVHRAFRAVRKEDLMDYHDMFSLLTALAQLVAAIAQLIAALRRPP